MSGTCLIDVLEGGDLDRFLSVSGSHDLALDSYGIIDESSFAAWPWPDLPSPPLTNDLRWKTGNPIERRAPSGMIVEEWLRIYDLCHSTRNDLATNFDAMDAWELPSDGATAGALTSGGTQFNGHVFCKRSWWKHATRNRYCIERAIATDNLWTGGATPDSLAETYINSSRSWSTSAGPTPIRNGKFVWNIGWRRLLFPWQPATVYQTGLVYIVTASWSIAEGVEEGEWSGLYPDWDPDNNPGWSIAGTAAGAGAHFGLSANTGNSTKVARWIVFAGDSLMCSSGDTITRPRSSLRNVFGFDEDCYLRAKRGAILAANAIDPGDISFTPKVGFFWYDGPAWHERFFRDESIELGSIGTSESDFDLTPAIDEIWNATAGVSSDTRIPCFWVGPAWGASIPTPGPFDPALDSRVFSTQATDNASVGGYQHGVPWCSDSGGGHSSPRICTPRYPFKSPLGGAS